MILRCQGLACVGGVLELVGMVFGLVGLVLLILFNLSGQRECQTWCLPKQFGHFAVVVSPCLCLLRQVSVVCLPAHTPHRKSEVH